MWFYKTSVMQKIRAASLAKQQCLYLYRFENDMSTSMTSVVLSFYDHPVIISTLYTNSLFTLVFILYGVIYNGNMSSEIKKENDRVV